MSQTHPTAVIVLAAGQGTRMKSALPTVMHPIGGRSLLHHSVAAAAKAFCFLLPMKAKTVTMIATTSLMPIFI